VSVTISAARSERDWTDAQEFERSWWGDCACTYGEETKQLVYAKYVNLRSVQIDGKGPFFPVDGKAIVDLGGGPTSLLLKVVGARRRVVIDPCEYPNWVRERYRECGVEWIRGPAENVRLGSCFDECWVYNVLQHVIDPRAVIECAKSLAPTIRLFEWVDVPPHPGHPHELTRERLDEWLGGRGTVLRMNADGCFGSAYFGVF
jgi:hypothetical protein